MNEIASKMKAARATINKIIEGQEVGVADSRPRLRDRLRLPYALRNAQSAKEAKALEERRQRKLARLNTTKSLLRHGTRLRGPFADEQPGDVVVSLNLRDVYLIDSDGARRRCTDPAAAKKAIDFVKAKIS